MPSVLSKTSLKVSPLVICVIHTFSPTDNPAAGGFPVPVGPGGQDAGGLWAASGGGKL